MEVGQKRNHSNANIMRENIIFGKKMKTRNEAEDDETPDFSKLFKTHDEDSCYTVDNNIYFNDDITMETMNKLTKEIRTLSGKLLSMKTKMGLEEAPPIKLHITSYGGSIHAAYKCINCIKNSNVPVHTIVDGFAASAGTLISVVGAKRYINKCSMMLIHELRSSTSWNKMSELEEEIDNLKKTMEQIKDIYEENTNMSRSELAKILKKDVDWDAKECLKRGLVDEII
jgi:ATP-dependent protease ClpP protease subunit